MTMIYTAFLNFNKMRKVRALVEGINLGYDAWRNQCDYSSVSRGVSTLRVVENLCHVGVKSD